jgi:hypothetical protein
MSAALMVQTSALYSQAPRTLIVVTAGAGMRVGNGVRLVAPSDEAPAVLAGSADWLAPCHAAAFSLPTGRSPVWMTV